MGLRRDMNVWVYECVSVYCKCKHCVCVCVCVCVCMCIFLLSLPDYMLCVVISLSYAFARVCLDSVVSVCVFIMGDVEVKRWGVGWGAFRTVCAQAVTDECGEESEGGY